MKKVFFLLWFESERLMKRFCTREKKVSHTHMERNKKRKMLNEWITAQSTSWTDRKNLPKQKYKNSLIEFVCSLCIMCLCVFSFEWQQRRRRRRSQRKKTYIVEILTKPSNCVLLFVEQFFFWDSSMRVYCSNGAKDCIANKPTNFFLVRSFSL